MWSCFMPGLGQLYIHRVIATLYILIWGLIGAGSGFLIGFAIDYFYQNKKQKKQRKLRGKTSERVLIIHCRVEQAEMIERVLWDNLALGVRRLDND